MSRYAIKIGVIHLTSDKPITGEDRRRAVQAVLANLRSIALEDGNLIIIDIVPVLPG